MPSLIISSRNTVDSQILRKAAQELGWETLRLDGDAVPDWFEPPDAAMALFVTAPLAFQLAAQLNRTLLGCPPDWTVNLPARFRLREMRQMTLAEALTLKGQWFFKHAISKAFPAGVYDAKTLRELTQNVPANALVHVVEPVNWTAEYRCFVKHGEIAAIAPYRRGNEIFEDHVQPLAAPDEERQAALAFAQSVVQSNEVRCPPAFVLDVGFIEGSGWAVVEFNECWASGIYGCEPEGVLETLLAACLRTNLMSADMTAWDFQRHYDAARGAS